MDWTGEITLLCTVVSAGAAVIAVWFASRTFRRSAELQAFLEFTKRYETIMDSLPSRARTDTRWSPEVDPDLAIRLRYLNLCSEEFYLMQRGLLSKTVWSIWETEMRATLGSDPYLDGWRTLARQFDSYPEFSGFVDTCQIGRQASGTAVAA
jgi:hypothetical protein